MADYVFTSFLAEQKRGFGWTAATNSDAGNKRGGGARSHRRDVSPDDATTGQSQPYLLNDKLICMGVAMKNLAIVGALMTVLALPASPAGAVGCITGGIAGGVAGHYAGHHGFLGAMGGCIAGHALHKKQMAERRLKHQQQMHPAQPAPAGSAQQP